MTLFMVWSAVVPADILQHAVFVLIKSYSHYLSVDVTFAIPMLLIFMIDILYNMSSGVSTISVI